MKQNRENHGAVDSVLEGIRCAQCTWCSEMQARRKRVQSFWVGLFLGAGLLFAVLSAVR